MIISFDLDGVLMENPFGNGVFPEVKEIIQSAYYSKKGKQLEKAEIMNMIRGKFELYLNKEPYLAYDWDFIINDVIKDLGLDLKIDIVELVEKFSCEPYIKVYQDGINILNWLESRDYELIVVTNGFYKYQFPVLKALELDQYFSRIVTSDRAEAAKPESDSFWVPDQDYDSWIHVGDSLVMDVCGSNDAGASSVYINRDFPAELREIPLVERLENQDVIAFIDKNLEKELENYQELHDSDLIYPRYIINNLEDLKEIILFEEVRCQD